MTTIEWTRSPDGTEGKTWNPISGCTPTSLGCLNCYAKRMAKRLAGRFGYPEAPHEFDVTLHRDKLDQPLRWKKPRMIFVVSMGDLFHENVPSRFIKRDVWNVMVDAKQHIFQLLTKRPNRMLELLEGHTPWPKNIWAGVSVEDADHLWRVEKLLQVPAAVHFVSLEPLLGPIDLCRPWGQGVGELMIESLDQIIIGGESGPGARPMHPDWARDIRDQCQEIGTPYFFKQWGAWAPVEALGVEWYDRVLPSTTQRTVVSARGLLGINDKLMYRAGKKRAGRLLDGREWNEMPEVAR